VQSDKKDKQDKVSKSNNDKSGNNNNESDHYLNDNSTKADNNIKSVSDDGNRPDTANASDHEREQMQQLQDKLLKSSKGGLSDSDCKDNDANKENDGGQGGGPDKKRDN
jgi:hypothetical protein